MTDHHPRPRPISIPGGDAILIPRTGTWLVIDGVARRVSEVDSTFDYAGPDVALIVMEGPTNDA